MSGFGLLSLGVQSLTANQNSLSVIGQNIANVNTEGYNRQVANLVTRDNMQGVYVSDIERITDQFLTQQVWADTANSSRADVYAELASQLDNLLGSEATSISSAMDRFFGAMQNAVDDPTSLPNRQLVVAEADALSIRFNDLNDYMSALSEQIDSKLAAATEKVNTITTNIAELNQKILESQNAGRTDNKLLDQREQLVTELSELVEVRVVEQGDGASNIFIGTGQPLVVGNRANPMGVQPDPFSGDDSIVTLSIAGKPQDVGNQLKSGEVGGLLGLRDQILRPAQNELGRIAIAFSETMNAQHQKGMDLNGELGLNLFKDVNDPRLMNERVQAASDNISTLTTGRVEIADVSALKSSDYDIDFSSPSNFTVTRLSDGAQMPMSSFKMAASPEDVGDGEYWADFNTGELVVGVDGLKASLKASGAYSTGDKIQLQPFVGGAEAIESEISDGRLLALASPLRVSTNTDNQGTAQASVEVTDVTDTAFGFEGKLTPPVEIVFTKDESTGDLSYTVLDISDPDNPQPLDLGVGPLKDQPFTPGEPIALNGYEVTVVNSPETGDSFSFSYNTDGVSDNRNALALSELQLKDTLEGGSYQDIYGGLIEKVGSDTAVAQINAEAGRNVLESSVNAKASVSGVNLDEEAAKLVQFQQAYQASAQIIRASQTIFDSLIGAI